MYLVNTALLRHSFSSTNSFFQQEATWQCLLFGSRDLVFPPPRYSYFALPTWSENR